MRSKTKAMKLLLGPPVAIALLAGAPIAAADGKKAPPDESATSFSIVRGGATTVTLDPGVAAALDSLGITVSPVGRARANKDGSISFPIPRGALDLTGPAGQYKHLGGLEFSKKGTTLRLSRFDINVDASPDLTAIVNRNRLDRPEIFDVVVTGTPSVNKGKLTIPGVELKLTAGGAAALNAVFKTDAFTGLVGAVIGTAETKTYIVRDRNLQKKLRLGRGGTTVALDPAFADKLAGANVAVSPVGAARPAVLGRVSFPIRPWRSHLRSDTLVGKIRHLGGLGLTQMPAPKPPAPKPPAPKPPAPKPPTVEKPAEAPKKPVADPKKPVAEPKKPVAEPKKPPADPKKPVADPKKPVDDPKKGPIVETSADGTTVELLRFTIRIRPDDAFLTGRLGRGGPRVELFSLDLSEAQTVVTPLAFRASGVKLSLTAGAAGALNDAFGLPGAFSAGEAVGTATVDSPVRTRVHKKMRATKPRR